MTNEFHKDHYPLSEDKMTVFLMKEMADGRRFASLNLWCATFSWYCFAESCHVSIVQAVYIGTEAPDDRGKIPPSRAAFLIEFFAPLHEKMDVDTAEDRLLFFLVCLSFHFFMCVGEITTLKVKNVQVNRERSLLSCTFERSRADQFGVGVTSYRPITNSLSNPVRYIDIISEKEPEEHICPRSSHSLISRLRRRLELIAVENRTAYSWHSFRRGAAFVASPGLCHQKTRLYSLRLYRGCEPGRKYACMQPIPRVWLGFETKGFPMIIMLIQILKFQFGK